MGKQVDEKDLINWWLEKYHGTNLDKILEENPTWAENPQEYTREFHDKYRVTQEEHDLWQLWAKEYVRKITKYPKKMIDKGWWAVYLNCSPSIIINNE